MLLLDWIDTLGLLPPDPAAQESIDGMQGVPRVDVLVS